MMSRRSFLRSMVGGVAAAAAVRTFPFRVFSFPKEITIVPALPELTAGGFFDPANYESFLRAVATDFQVPRRMLGPFHPDEVALLKSLTDCCGRPLL